MGWKSRRITVGTASNWLHPRRQTGNSGSCALLTGANFKASLDFAVCATFKVQATTVNAAKDPSAPGFLSNPLPIVSHGRQPLRFGVMGLRAVKLGDEEALPLQFA
jgi:hypothetical protein